MTHRCGHTYAFGSCLNMIAEDLTFCIRHDPDEKNRRSAEARKRTRARKPQGLASARPEEMRRVKRWFEHGGGAEAFEAFAAYQSN